LSSPHIGTLGEKPLHASLKQHLFRPGDRFEVPVDGFVVDLVRGGELIEVQTCSMSSMKRKLGCLLPYHKVRVVHPVPLAKWIVKLDADGTVTSRRKSPRAGSGADAFSELVHMVGALSHPNLRLDLLYTHEDEVRIHAAGRAKRRKGWLIVERRLLEVTGQQVIFEPADLVGLLPDGLPETFTTAQLATALGRPRRLAQQAAYVLRKLGVLEVDGKVGNAWRYRLGVCARDVSPVVPAG